ncbi:hypothetical protein MnTg04_00012 [bacterium MnTg04]|nr:hypothetical protein MnTg04_00012 [bacterium MnTg04]
MHRVIHRTEIAQRVRVARCGGQSLENQFLGTQVPTLLMMNQAQEMQCVKLAGVGLQYPLVDRLRFIKRPRLVQPERLVEKLLQRHLAAIIKANGLIHNE